jgi:circadian clock protein KaiC
MYREVADFKPAMVVVDPVSNLADAGTLKDASAMLTRLMDFLKFREVTGLLVSLTTGDAAREATEVGISSVIDTWLLLRDIELGGERNRAIYVLKSRGMAHSNQVREFLITAKGVQLEDVYVGPEGVLTGSMRLAQEARAKAAARARTREATGRQLSVATRRKALEAQIAALHAEIAEQEESLRRFASGEAEQERELTKERDEMARSRKADAPARPIGVNGRPGARQ